MSIKTFRRSIKRPVKKRGWSCTRQIEVQNIPNVHIRYGPAQRNKLDEEVDRVNYQSLNACRCQFLAQVLESHSGEVRTYIHTRMPQHRKALQLCHEAIDSCRWNRRDT